MRTAYSWWFVATLLGLLGACEDGGVRRPRAFEAADGAVDRDAGVTLATADAGDDAGGRDAATVDAALGHDGSVAFDAAMDDAAADAASVHDAAVDASAEDAADDASTTLCDPGATEPCYTGPAGTLDVGACTAGTRTCLGDGSAWSVCDGEVTPIAEICSNAIDDDCNDAVDDSLDADGDGFARCDGDCCDDAADCAAPALVNPAALELPTAIDATPLDEDCDSSVDEVSPTCDADLALDDADALNAARAIELCEATSPEQRWGVVSAQYTRGNGTALGAAVQHGLMESFGSNVSAQAGARMLVLSTGHARSAAQPDECGGESCLNTTDGSAPTGFPQTTASCPTTSSVVRDDVALHVQLRAPSNATGIRFDFAFYSFEYPEWVCTELNDQFVVLMDPAPAGAIHGNIAFDAQGNPVSVNAGFLDVCDGCPLGTDALAGTGFDTWDMDGAGATGWLHAAAPVVAGSELTLRFLIFDVGDSTVDSTVLIDNFQWLTDATTVGTTPK